MNPMLTGCIVLTTLGLAFAPQEPEPEQEPGRDLEEELQGVEDLVGGGQDQLRKELTELFHSVERNLIEIDEKLGDAGAGVVPLDEVADSGLDDLLRSTSQESGRVLEDIDRILEIASQMGGGSSMQGMGEPPPQGSSPLDQERSQGPQGREETPEAPDGPKPGEKPGDKPEGQKPQDGDDPKDSPAPNPLDGENRPGDPNDPADDSPPSNVDDANAWGNLPVRVREIFRNQGGEEMPVQYRDWIDSYYRRLSRKR